MERRAAVEEAVGHLPLMLTVEQARQVLGIGRSLAYEVRRYLATDGQEGIPAVRIGSAIRVPRAGLVDLLLAAPAPAGSEPRLQVVPTITSRHPSRSHASSTRPPRSLRSGDAAQLPFAAPTGG